MITFGNTSVQMGLVVVLLAVLVVKLLFITVGVWFVVQGFKVRWAWGLANLLIPGAIIPFCILHPKESKKPMILAGACLALFSFIWIVARYGSHSRPRVELAPALPASVTNAVLRLNLASPNNIETMSCSVSLKSPFHGGTPADSYDEERLAAIRSDGFLMQFTTRIGREMQTNVVLFPYGQTTETNTFTWRIVGNYSDNMKTLHNMLPEPTANSSFHFLTPIK